MKACIGELRNEKKNKIRIQIFSLEAKSLRLSGLIPGITIIVLAAIFTGYTGVQLGDNWTLMQKRWPEYKSHCRRPYPEMAYRAMGTKAKRLVAFCLCLTQFGIATVLTLLAANNLSNLLAAVGFPINFCYVILLISAVLWPFVMLKSPMDFWQAAVGAAVSSTVAAMLIVAGAIHDAPVCRPAVSHPEFSFTNLFLAYGTIAFAYGGHGAFPTIQHDMTKPFRFNRAVWASYIFILIVYIIVSSTGYSVYGDSMRNTVIPSLQIGWLSQLVNVMITVHVLPTVVIVFSPLAQQVEEWTNVPQRHFSMRRFAIRSVMLFGIVFTAESIPHFGVLVAQPSTLMTMLLPSVFYLFLFASHNKRKDLINTMQISPDSPDNQLAGLIE
ncbi:transmembrane amino acid transporter protein [Ostertagia ostertagi]